MSEIKWTESQKRAIEHRDENMLVSASAGSGKTAVLTSRLIGMLTDKDNPCDISRVLIVTFTRKASSELKEKIANALEKEIEKNPASKHLARQRMLLGSAKISTIDAFCYEMVKNNFASLALPAGMRIAEESEIALLAKTVMDEAIEYMYENDGTFFTFASILTTERSEKSLCDIFCGIYNSLNSYESKIGFVKEYAHELLNVRKENFASGKWGEMLENAIAPAFEHYYSVFEAGCDYLRGDDKLAKSYLPMFENDLSFISEAKEMIKTREYSSLKRLFDAYQPMRLGVARNADEYTRALKNERDSFKKVQEDYRKKYFAYDFEQVMKQFTLTSEICMTLYHLLEEFDRRFSTEKLRRKILSFSDVEHYAYRLLFDENGGKTDVAESISNSFDYIFVDEYQDTNRLQDRIFEGIRRENNFFIVGDIKQSIYAFRGSQPLLFEEYRLREDFEHITLSENFRSDSTIINFANAVTEGLFGKGRSGFSYSEGDLLVHSAGNDGKKRVEVVICEGKKEGISEAEFIISSIKEAVLSGVEAEKIAVLFRSGGKKVSQIENALKKASIPHSAVIKDDFFNQPDVLFLICLLNVIDNPRREIYLAGALKSPLFGFTPSELAEIKYSNFSKATDDSSAGYQENLYRDTLYDALREYKSDKVRRFFDFLEKYRFLAKSSSADRLLFLLYRGEGLEAFCKKGNMVTLYHAALKFESGSYKGLYSFINYIDDLISAGKGISNDGENTRPGEVAFMSIHRSKGLEYDTVILIDSDRNYNRRDLSGPLLFSSEGIGVYIPDNTGFARNDTLIRNLIARYMENSAAEEEKRVLYTALTRAKKNLRITASFDKPEEFIEKCRLESNFLSSYSINSQKNQISSILSALLRAEYESFCDLKICSSSGMVQTYAEYKDIGEEGESVEYGKEKEILESRFSFEYPYLYATALPAKVSVSLLYPDMLDYDAADEEYKEEYSFDEMPLFISGETAELGIKKGNATHLFMQFCDFEIVKAKGVEFEVERLTALKFIRKEEAENINVGAVKRFFESDLFSEMSLSKKLLREKRFNVKLPASMFTTDEKLKFQLKNETILAQGVIDCLFEDQNGDLVLVDYKTDYIPSGERVNGEKILIERHERQLKYYAGAVKTILKREVQNIYIYSFSLGRAITVLV